MGSVGSLSGIGRTPSCGRTGKRFQPTLSAVARSGGATQPTPDRRTGTTRATTYSPAVATAVCTKAATSTEKFGKIPKTLNASATMVARTTHARTGNRNDGALVEKFADVARQADRTGPAGDGDAAVDHEHHRGGGPDDPKADRKCPEERPACDHRDERTQHVPREQQAPDEHALFQQTVRVERHVLPCLSRT